MELDERLKRMMENRPKFKQRAIITGGMPYGNKELHFGHIGGMFVFADCYARFLRDRIGKENVIFVSGTDCYGSPAMEGHRKLVEAGKFTGSIEEYVKSNHLKQVQTFKDYEISLNFFGASGFGDAKPIHAQMGKDVFNALYQAGTIKKLETLQFFDEQAKTFLNGRQVIGKCPIEGCQSEKAYADECDLGHQFMPKELLNPISTLTGTTPVLKGIANWYFCLENFIPELKEWNDNNTKLPFARSYANKEINEFLKKPEIYIKKDMLETFKQLSSQLAPCEITDLNKPSFTVVFEKLEDREQACEVLTNKGIRYRTGKTLTPFRLSGNIEWGAPIPEIENHSEMNGLTFYVWPESLWAPISFTKTYLLKQGKPETEWKKWWCSEECEIHQFIGEDNLYFYGPAQHAMWFAMKNNDVMGNLCSSRIISNKHILFLNTKASSSGAIKPPMAHELLNFYTAEQLRAHFLGLALGNNNVSFMPKPYNPQATAEEVDPVLKDGNLYTNAFNRAVRTLFYTVQKEFNGVLPTGEIDSEVNTTCVNAILNYERFMYQNKFHQVSYVLDEFIRGINKYYTKAQKVFEETKNMSDLKTAIVNMAHLIRVATVLCHPIVPSGSEKVAEYLNVNKDMFYDWKYIFEPLSFFMQAEHKIKEIPPRFDFFKKHPSQLISEE